MDIQTLLESALGDAQSGRFAAAETKLLALLDEPLGDNDSATIRGILGAVYASMENHIAAARELAKAAAGNPGDASVLSNLCNSLVQTGDFEDAIAAGRKATGINPGFAQAHNNLGNALKANGDPEGAQQSYRLALQIDPGNAVAHNNLGTALFAVGDPARAIASFRQAIQLRPDYAAAYGNLADAYRATGDLDNALANCDRMLELRPDDPESHKILAIVQRGRGEARLALDSFRRALDLDPACESAVQGLGEVLLQSGRHAEGLDVLSKTFGVIRFETGVGVSIESGERA